MVREARLRKRKLISKLDPQIYAKRFEAQREDIIEQAGVAWQQQEDAETLAKLICENRGIGAHLLPQYICFAREALRLRLKYSGLTLRREMGNRIDKWEKRGLDRDVLVTISKGEGVDPVLPPVPPHTHRFKDIVDALWPYIGNFAVAKPPKAEYPFTWYTSLLAQYMPTTRTVWYNNLIANPYIVPLKSRWDAIGIYIVTAVAEGKIRLGLYTDNGLYPDKLLVDSGDLDASTTGTKYKEIDLTLDRGLYWIVGLTNKLGIEVYSTEIGVCPLGGDEPYGNLSCWTIGYTYGALPSTYPYDAGAWEYYYSFSLRLAEVLKP